MWSLSDAPFKDPLGVHGGGLDGDGLGFFTVRVILMKSSICLDQVSLMC